MEVWFDNNGTPIEPKWVMIRPFTINNSFVELGHIPTLTPTQNDETIMSSIFKVDQ